MSDCNICCEKLKKPITCNFCDFVSCTSCVRHYLLDTQSDPHCMSCNKKWTRNFIDENFPKTFINKELKKHREEVLVEREKALLPSTQVLVEQELYKRKQRIEIDNLNKRKRELNDELMRVNRDLRIAYDRLYYGEEESIKKEKAQFIKKCPADGCMGYLSTQYKCGICNIWVCPDCHEIKGDTKDAEHTCDPNSVETAKMIAKDTKPCPNCSTRIYKIDGCFAPDTEIKLWNGQIKFAKNIEVGDVLIGEDGYSRTVESLCNGKDMMYNIIQNNAINYTVNSKHTLCLKISGNNKIAYVNNVWKFNWFEHSELSFKQKQFASETEAIEFKNNNKSDDTLQILVDDYMKLSKRTKDSLYGYRSKGINYSPNEIHIDPYLLGIWLGDGYSNGTDISAADTEVIEYLLKWAEQNDAEVIHIAPYRFKLKRKGHSLGRKSIGNESCDTCKGCEGNKIKLCDEYVPLATDNTHSIERTNPLKTQLNKYNLVENKHIPVEFLTNSKENRLQLLAGLIDSDGHVSNSGKRITIVNTNLKLATEIVNLSRSLGFITTIIKKERFHEKCFDNYEAKSYQTIYLINISGEYLSEIPTKIIRKKCNNSKYNKDMYRTSITVKSIGMGEYFGWKLKEDDHRFILNDYTVTKNCDQMFCTNCNTAFSWRTGQKVIAAVIHNPHYYEWRRNQNGGEIPRQPGDNPCGGLPRLHTLSSTIKKLKLHPRDEITFNLFCIHRCISHIEFSEIPSYTYTENLNNSDLRVSYMLKDIDVKTLQMRLQQREKKNEKNLEMSQILQMFMQTSSEIIREIVYNEEITIADIKKHIETLGNLKDYTNTNFAKISKRYACVAPFIQDDWIVRSIKR